jgi:hypothetical protein
MFRSKDATVTQCHSKTKNLPEIVSSHTPYNGSPIHDSTLI